MASDPPMRFNDLVENFIMREDHLQMTLEDIQRWIKFQHLKRGEPIPLALTTKRYATRLYKVVHPNDVG
jgi:hypothetical protein